MVSGSAPGTRSVGKLITKGDSGHSQFNASELVGNFAAAGISNAYYPAADRSFGNTANKWSNRLVWIRPSRL
jgi:hypothetical protein